MVNIGCTFKTYRVVVTFYLSVHGERCLRLHRDWWSPAGSQEQLSTSTFTFSYHSTIKGFHPSTHKHSRRHVRETIALDSALEDGGRIICQSCSGITVRFFQCRGHSQTVPRSAEGRGCCAQRHARSDEQSETAHPPLPTKITPSSTEIQILSQLSPLKPDIGVRREIWREVSFWISEESALEAGRLIQGQK